MNTTGEKWIYVNENKGDFCRFMYSQGWEEVISELALQRQHKNGYVRKKAVQFLTAIGVPQVLEPVTSFLDDDFTDSRKAAIQALGEIGDERVLNSLAQCAQDKNLILRLSARNAIKKIESRQKKSQ